MKLHGSANPGAANQGRQPFHNCNCRRTISPDTSRIPCHALSRVSTKSPRTISRSADVNCRAMTSMSFHAIFLIRPVPSVARPGRTIADADHGVVEASCCGCAGGRYADHPLRAAPSLRRALSHPGFDHSFSLKPVERCVQSADRTSSACRLRNRFTHSDTVGVLAESGCRCDQKVFEFAEHSYNYNVILMLDLVNKKEVDARVPIVRTTQCIHGPRFGSEFAPR